MSLTAYWVQSSCKAQVVQAKTPIHAIKALYPRVKALRLATVADYDYCVEWDTNRRKYYYIEKCA